MLNTILKIGFPKMLLPFIVKITHLNYTDFKSQLFYQLLRIQALIQDLSKAYFESVIYTITQQFANVSTMYTNKENKHITKLKPVM